MARNRRSPALILAIVLLLAGVPATAAASPGVGASPSGVAAVPLAQREVFGFFTSAERDYMLNVADFSVLTTVAFFALDAKPDGTLALKTPSGANTPEWAAWNSAWMDQLFARAHAQDARVVLTVKRFGWNAAERAEMVELLSSATRRQNLAEQIAQVVVARGADGVNLDFEPMLSDISAEFVDFTRRVRTELDERRSGLQLTIDATGHGSNYDVAGLTAPGAAHAVFIMGYPFHGSFTERAGAMSPLSGLSYDLTDAVNRFLSKTTPDKVIMGMAYYGYEWPTQTKALHSLVRPKNESATWGPQRSRSLDTAIKMAKQTGVRWDAEQLVPWTRWQARACDTCPLTWRQLYFDNKRSLGLKYDMARSKDLRGVGYWRIGMEGNRPALYQLIRDRFLAP
jgi:spore germination protein YaaH